MRRPHPILIGLLMSGCGGRGEALTGDLAEGFDADRVVLASGGEARVGDARFELRRPPGDSLTLRFLRGADTIGTLELSAAPSASIALAGLRVDPATGRVFPGGLGGDAGDVVTVNGVRYVASPLPDSVDGSGRVLAATDAGDAFLFRTDAMGPDLRVVMDSAARVETADGEAVAGWRSRSGDSLRVAGRVREGIVHVTRLTLPSEAALEAAASAPEPEPEPAAAPRTVSEPVPVVRSAPQRSSPPGRGHGRGGGHGRGRGHGKKG